MHTLSESIKQISLFNISTDVIVVDTPSINEHVSASLLCMNIVQVKNSLIVTDLVMDGDRVSDVLSLQMVRDLAVDLLSTQSFGKLIIII